MRIRNLKYILILFCFLSGLGRISYAQTSENQTLNIPTINTELQQTPGEELSSDIANGTIATGKRMAATTSELVDDPSLTKITNYYDDLGCWECVVVSNMFDTVNTVFYSFYKKISLSLISLMVLFFCFWLIRMYIDNAKKQSVFISGEQDIRKILKMILILGFCMILLTLPSRYIYKYTVTPALNGSTWLSSQMLETMENQMKSSQTNGGQDMAKLKIRDTEVEALVSDKYFKDIDKNGDSDKRLFDSDMKNELLYVINQYSQTYNYGIRFGLELGVSAGEAFLTQEVVRMLLVKAGIEIITDLSFAIPIAGPAISKVLGYILPKIEYVLEKTQRARRWIYMQMISFGWLIIVLYFTMSLKFLLVIMNAIMQFTVAALLTPFAIGAYPFKDLGMASFINTIRGKFIGAICYIAMISIISSFIYFILNQILITEYMFNGHPQSLMEILNSTCGGSVWHAVVGNPFEFLMFLYHNIEIPIMFCAAAYLGVHLLSKSASLTSHYLHPVDTSYEKLFSQQFFSAYTKLISGKRKIVSKTGENFTDNSKGNTSSTGSTTSPSPESPTPPTSPTPPSSAPLSMVINTLNSAINAFNTQEEINDLNRNINNNMNEIPEYIRDKISSLNILDSEADNTNIDEKINSVINDSSMDLEEYLDKNISTDSNFIKADTTQKQTIKSALKSGEGLSKIDNIYGDNIENHELNQAIMDKYIDQESRATNKSRTTLISEYRFKIANKNDAEFNYRIGNLKSEIAAEKKNEAKQIYAENKVKFLMGNKEFIKDITESGIANRFDITDKDNVKKNAIILVEFAEKDRNKNYLKETEEQKSQKKQTIKSILQSQKEIFNLKNNNDYKNTKHFDFQNKEISKKDILEKINSTKLSIIDIAKNNLLESGLDNNLEQREITMLTVLERKTKNKIKEFKNLNDEEIEDEESLEDNLDSVKKIMQIGGMNSELATLKRNSKKNDRILDNQENDEDESDEKSTRKIKLNSSYNEDDEDDSSDLNMAS